MKVKAKEKNCTAKHSPRGRNPGKYNTEVKNCTGKHQHKYILRQAKIKKR